MKACIKLAIFVFFVLFASSAAFATLGTVTINNVNGYFTDGTIRIWGGSLSGVEGYGGFYLINKTSGTGAGLLIPDGQIDSFCIELPQSPSGSPVVYNVVNPQDAPDPATYGLIGADKQAYLEELWGRYYAQAKTSGSLAEALSAAVWEIVYEDYESDVLNYDVTVWDGTAYSFKCELADTTTANNWLHSLTGTGPKANLFALTDGTYQDFLVTPEPTTIALFGIGGLFAALKRNKK